MIKRIFILLLITSVTQATHAVSVNDVIRMQSSVKSQGSVASCSIFSAIGLLEHKLMVLEPRNRGVDLSEQWLLYTTAGQKGSVGVLSPENIAALDNYGFVTESHWQFSSLPWDDTQNRGIFRSTLNSRRCSHLEGTSLINHCLIGQRDPRFLSATDEDLQSWDPDFLGIRQYAQNMASAVSIRSEIVSSKETILRLLNAGEALLVDVKFYPEAWNHRRAPESGLIRDMDLWEQGIVSYPDRRTKDYALGRNTRTGHSMVVVGYDSQKVIERQVMDANGRQILVRSVGVFYFKNSWGTDSFGKKFSVNGERFPGYGMIAMDYVFDRDANNEPNAQFVRMIVQ
jgi:hypothetical protein